MGINVYPAITINYPQNTTYFANVSGLNYTTDDINGLSNCWYSNSTGRWNSSFVSGGTNFSDIISVEGSNTWTVYCNDTAGNMNYTNVTFYKNSSGITSIVINQSNSIGGTVVRGTNFTINATVSGASSVWA